MKKLKPVMIAAPFGNWIDLPGATRVRGTHTSERRAGSLTRAWRYFRTVHTYRQADSDINCMKLPSPGIDSEKDRDVSMDSISVHGFDFKDWCNVINKACLLDPMAVEVNFGCPNVAGTDRLLIIRVVEWCFAVWPDVIFEFKIGPVRPLEIIDTIFEYGGRIFHLCNTAPTPGGGMSGKVLKPFSVWACEDARQKYGNLIQITAGGGIFSVDDAKDYLVPNIDADRISLATIFRRWGGKAEARNIIAYMHAHETIRNARKERAKEDYLRNARAGNSGPEAPGAQTGP